MPEEPRTVLILERDQATATELVVFLESHGYQIGGLTRTAADAARLAAERRPHLALLDPQDGETRAELLLAIELERQGIGVVFLTPILRGDRARQRWNEELLLHALDVAFRTRRPPS